MNSKNITRKVNGLKKFFKREYLKICENGAKTPNLSFFADNYRTVFEACEYILAQNGTIKFSSNMLAAKAVANLSTEKFMPTARMLEVVSAHKITEYEAEFFKAEVAFCLLLETKTAILKGYDCRKFISLLADISSIDELAIIKNLSPIEFWLCRQPAYKNSSKETKAWVRPKVLRAKFPEEYAKKLSSLEQAEFCKKAFSSAKLPRTLIVLSYNLILLVLSVLLCYKIGLEILDMWAFLLVLPAFEAIKAIFDPIVMLLIPPPFLPSLNENCLAVKTTKTAIVLSAAVGGTDGAEALYARLYKLYLTNPQQNIKVVALVDLFAEAAPTAAEDRAVFGVLGEVIERLNRKCSGKFFCVVRKRSYSKTQDEFMGAERKRGAIIELCKFMATTKQDFAAIFGDINELLDTEYICAVDFDTEPFMDSVPKLLATALHPANRIVIEKSRVISGYGIFAPKMTVKLSESLASGFSKAMGGIGSVSGYHTADKDYWQSISGYANFCGKGLISVEALLRLADCLPKERVLSHDILEGELLKTAFCNQVTFAEGFPKTAESYFKRLDRWVRGDFQNLPFCFSEKFGIVSKLKLLSNIRRELTPLFVILCLFASFWVYDKAANPLAIIAMTFYLLPQIGGILRAILVQIFNRASLASAAELWKRDIFSAFYKLVLLPALAVKQLKAGITATIRLITKKRLLEWTTQHLADGQTRDPISFWFFSELMGIVLLFSPATAVKLFAIAFASLPILILVGEMPIKKKKLALSYRQQRELASSLADMWQFYADCVTEADNHLPPDNLQFAPVYKICHRTSPTNIGFYMLCCLVACDRKLIGVHNLCKRLSLTLNSVEKLKKYKGNLYNWYQTDTLAPCPNPYVSSVDSGNFICCIATLCEGLKEYLPRCSELEAVILRLESLIKNCDLSAFYNPTKDLLSIGINPENGQPDGYYYDCLISEARLTSYFAIATRQVPKSHWQRLSRREISYGFSSGAASYSGTMFEYFMPYIFTPAPEGSLIGESLEHAIRCQKKYADALSRPFGISESGYYSFDQSLCYLYKAHGVPKTGLKQGLEKSYVVSPYSTYLALEYCPVSGAANLKRLREMGLYSRYGFYEAIDFDHNPPKSVKSYMAHHIGMSILAVQNLLTNGEIRERFMKNEAVAGASELLNERPSLGSRIFENSFIKPKAVKADEAYEKAECFGELSPFSPRFRLLENGEYSLAITDLGTSYAWYRGKLVYRQTSNNLLRENGLLVGLAVDGNGKQLKPDTAEFGSGYALLEAKISGINCKMQAFIDKSLPCEVRKIVLENKENAEKKVELMAFAEPVLQDALAYSSHPAFEKMRLRLEFDPKNGIAIAKRISKNGNDECYMAMGFLEQNDIFYSFNREDVLKNGFENLFSSYKQIEKSMVAEPDPCIFIKAKIKLEANQKTAVTMFTVCAQTKDELLNSVATIKAKGTAPLKMPLSPGLRLAERLLPSILLGGEMPNERKEAIAKNKLRLNALWELGIPTDKPLILAHLNNKNDENKLQAYLSAYRYLTVAGIKATLVFTCTDQGSYTRPQYQSLVDNARILGLEGLIYSEILPIEWGNLSNETANLLTTYACHTAVDSIIKDDALPPIKPMLEIAKSNPTPQPVENKGQCGGFDGNSYIINEKPPIVWSHILSNPQFGCLVSSNSLGFTYAFNSRENRLTPWENDAIRGNKGERLLLKIGNKYFDLIDGAAAKFSPYKAEYFFQGEGYQGSTAVLVSNKGLCKKIEVEIEANGELCYYLEPCLGVDRSKSAMIYPERIENGVVLQSCASEILGYMAVSCDKAISLTTDKQAFLQGDLKESIEPAKSPALVCICKVKGKQKLSFFVSYALNKKASIMMPSLFAQQISTKENELYIETEKREIAPFANELLRYQALHARIWARTGFYQCSGAFGFRDQLQDALCIVLENPDICKRQILRCCCAQFAEGDVLHWWHSLPQNKIRGIRTKISDDLLWLPFAVCEYVEKTGDFGILSLKTAYCTGIELNGKAEYYGKVGKTSEKAGVLEHCIKAIELVAGKVGSHGLLLIGAGDWNDGFSSVGEKGLGESVWLTEFYILVLKRFSEICTDMPWYQNTLLSRARAFETAIEMHGKCKTHYLRAYFDSGEKLGVDSSEYCKIDSIAQSFAEFAEIGSLDFNRLALKTAYDSLADIKHGVIKLFWPPFEANALPHPGYIASYPLGLRENGGQYTHASVWLGMACIKAGLEAEGLNILQAINPFTKNTHYKAEPYYLCGDVYANKNCYARGGWSIYTGSAAWYYKAITEDILGIRLKNGKIEIKKPLMRCKIEHKNKSAEN